MEDKKKLSGYLLRQAHALFDDDAEREAFIEALQLGESREQSIIVLEDHPAIRTFPRLGKLDWQPEFVERIGAGFRAPKHPLYEKGAYYSLDLSSVFCASAVLAIPGPVRRVWDVCAAPGGKAIFAWRAHHPEVLACNETIRKRTGSLISNLDRCKITGSVVWSADPSVWAKKFPEAFDLILVDAPCSGQSLIAKGDPAPGCFAPTMIDMCVGRQRRILGHAARALRPGGHMVYSTCTYAKQENEKVIAWILAQYDWLEAVPIPKLASHQSPFAEFPCYRLFPHEGIGAGGFVTLLRHKGEPPEHWTSLETLTGLWKYGDPVRRSENHESAPDPAVTETEKKAPKPKPAARRSSRPPLPPKRKAPKKSRRGQGRSR